MIGAVAALVAASSISQASYPQASYPTTLDREAIAAWLPQAAGLAANQVIAVTSSSAIAIVTRTRTPEGHVGVLLRALPLTPEATARGGVLAWQMHLEIDCATGAVRPGGTTGFDSQRAEGEGVPLTLPEASWRPPKPGTPLESARRAACEPDFQPPLIVAGQRLAKATPASAPPIGPAPVTPAPVAVAAVTPTHAPTAAQAPQLGPQRASVQATLSASLRPPLPAPFFPPNPAARPATNAAPSKPGPGAVQVVSSPTQAGTQQALISLQGRFTALRGLQPRVEPAQVRGRTVYRGIIAGFGSFEEARAACETLKRGGQDCLAR